MRKIFIFSILAVTIFGLSIGAVSAQSQYDIPSWVKGVAGYWSEGKITDNDFGEAVSFLIEQKIIRVQMPDVENTSNLKNQVSQLESENSQLKNQIRDLTEQNSKLQKELNPTQKANSEIKSQTGFSSLVCKKGEFGYVQLNGKYTSDRDYSFVSIEFGIIGDNGEVLDTGIAIIQDIKAGQTKIFSADSLYSGNFRSCEVQVSNGY